MKNISPNVGLFNFLRILCHATLRSLPWAGRRNNRPTQVSLWWANIWWHRREHGQMVHVLWRGWCDKEKVGRKELMGVPPKESWYPPSLGSCKKTNLSLWPSLQQQPQCGLVSKYPDTSEDCEDAQDQDCCIWPCWCSRAMPLQEPSISEWPGLPPRTMEVSCPELWPVAYSGFVVLPQPWSVLMSMVPVTFKGCAAMALGSELTPGLPLKSRGHPAAGLMLI